MKKLLAAALVAVIILGVLAGCGPGESTVDEDSAILATYEDYELPFSVYLLYYRSFQTDLEQRAASYGYTSTNIDEFWDIELDTGRTYREEIAYQSLDYAKKRAVQHKLALEKGLEFDDTDLLETMNTLLENVGGDENAFAEAYLMTWHEMLEAYRYMSLCDMYVDEIQQDMDFSYEEVTAFHDEDPNSYDLVRVRHVLITCGETATDEERETAKTLAEEVLDMVNSGSDIGELAAEYSEDGGSASNNGEYTFGANEMVKPFEAWAFAAEDGDTGLVESEFGFHVMQKFERYGLENSDVWETTYYALTLARIEEITKATELASQDWEVDEALYSTVTL